jgi:hypothetical protein
MSSAMSWQVAIGRVRELELAAKRKPRPRKK